jgi:hypothetical protein
MVTHVAHCAQPPALGSKTADPGIGIGCRIERSLAWRWGTWERLFEGPHTAVRGRTELYGMWWLSCNGKSLLRHHGGVIFS